MINVMWDAGADQSLGLPRYETAGAAGADLRANLPDKGVVDLPPGRARLDPHGAADADPPRL
jgi:dUTPase